WCVRTTTSTVSPPRRKTSLDCWTRRRMHWVIRSAPLEEEGDKAMRRRTFTFAATGAALAGWRPAAFAQAWPERPVKLILAHPAGSGVDNVARVVADRVSRGWGQQVVIENKPGGQNLIGAQYAARSPADGYNFYFATSAALVTNVYLFKALPYDPQKDFVPVGLIGRSHLAILVEDKSPLRSIADLLARARAQPGRVSIAIEGPKTFGGM